MNTHILRTGATQPSTDEQQGSQLSIVLPLTEGQTAAIDAIERIAVTIPCLNEEKTIAKVVRDFRTQLPHATIYVFDNNSSDNTAEEAARAGAIVLREPRKGKGYVVQSMFLRVEADIYIMVDGDDTYPAEMVHALIAPVANGQADMVVGSRLLSHSSEFHYLNRFGNNLFLALVNKFFRTRLTDILSGYRVMHRRFVKGVPLFQAGFETEIELTIKALERGYRLQEVPTTLRPRPSGSNSKIRILKDGVRILSTLLALFRDYKPLTVFGSLGLFLLALSLVPGWVVVREFLRTGNVLHLPSGILAVGIALSGMLSATVGLVLHTIDRRFQELEYFARVVKR